MLGNFFRRSTDRKKCVHENKALKVTVLPQVFLGPRLRQHCQFLCLRFFKVKTIFFYAKGVSENKGNRHQRRIITFLIISVLK